MFNKSIRLSVMVINLIWNFKVMCWFIPTILQAEVYICRKIKFLIYFDTKEFTRLQSSHGRMHLINCVSTRIEQF